MNPTPAEILKQYWGYDSFRPVQEDIVNSVLAGKDTLALLPTGGGKSVCFQVPAMCMPGLCLVVTPLIALMADQVDHLLKRGINAVCMHSGMHPHEITMAFEKCADGRSKFLYLSPERLESRKFRELLRQLNVSLIAVDEAHCISQWGYDFRPPYLRIADIRDMFPKVPVIALTATAVAKVVDDIQDKLAFARRNVFSRSFVRSNLAYITFREEDKHKKLLRICHGVSGTGIVYVRNRKMTKEVSEFLNQHGITATFYHAGLDPKIRQQRQEQWMQNHIRIMVATNAFGMGIDKPDVRLVVHMDIPETIEYYFQEAGRAGRDGKKAFAVILFNEHDIVNSRLNLEQTWPPPAIVRSVYNALGNFLQLPVGAGRDVSFNFDLDLFCKTYVLKPVTTFSALKILEREGYIALNDVWDESSRIFFCCARENLYAYQVEHADADKLIKVIMRSYSGVFTDFVQVNENEIARRSGIDSPQVAVLLTKLQKAGILDYLPRKTTPQLIFITERLETESIALSKTYYLDRKRDAALKLEEIIRYCTTGDVCRSRMLVSYFGDSNSHDCGICDVCIAKRRSAIGSDEAANIESLVLKILQRGPLSLESLVRLLPNFKEDDLLAVVRWLNENSKLTFDGEIIQNTG